jgi:hypothetical protein
MIIDDADITTIAKLHSQVITDYRQITSLLEQTTEWEEEWSRKIFNVIQKFNEDLNMLRRTTVTKAKTQQKRARIELDTLSFQESTKENEERIRALVLQRFTASQQQNTSSSGAVTVLSSTRTST